MKRLYNPYRSGAVFAFGLLTALSLPASAQRFGPDQLQTLGVGSRAVAMGDAFAAIADDASATFWNPGRLSSLIFARNGQAMLSYRTVDNSFASNNLTTGLDSASFRPGKPQLGFASFAFPLSALVRGKGGTHKKPLGTIGVSYTLGGYFSLDRTQTSQGIPTVGAPVPYTSSITDTTVRNSFLTIAYGTKLSRTVGFGIGAFFVNQDFTKNSTSFAFVPGDPTHPLPTPNQASERGRGYGVNVGLCYDIPAKAPKPNATDYSSHISIGMAYRSQTHLSGLGDQGQGFNEELPGRFSLGVASYQQLHSHYNWKKKLFNGDIKANIVPDQLTTSVEFQALQAANRSYDSLGNLKLTDARNAVGNFHLGVEYIPGILNKPGAYKIPLRFGFRTNANAAFKYSYYDTVFSAGFAYIAGGDNATYSIEPALEVLTTNGALNLTLTGQLRF